MGIVYLAERPNGEGLCALKILSPQLAVDQSFAVRFRREAEYAQGLDHANILKLYAAGETPDGTPYFAMEYIQGVDLKALIARDGVLQLPTAVWILHQVGSALDSAHA